jgi:hypothetical protein
MRVSDSVRVSITVVPQPATGTVRVELMDTWGNRVSNNITNTGSNIEGTLRATQADNLRILITNNSAHDLVMSGLVTYNLQVNTFNTRIFYDSTFGSNNNQTKNALISHLNGAKQSIRNNFAVDLITNINIVNLSTNLNGGNCGNSLLAETCIRGNPPGGCGMVCYTGNTSTSHHKSADKLLDIYPPSGTFTVRMVGHSICATIGTAHPEVFGVADAPGRDSLVSNQSPNPTSTMQHELGHNLGRSGHCNDDTPNTWCVMKTFDHARRRMDAWCNNCYAAIIRRRG